MDQGRQLRALQAQVQQREHPPQIPDVIADPNAYHQHVTQTFEDRLRNMEANFSFRLAHQVHGETFEKAYGEMIGRAERGDPSVVRAVMQSPDPGAAMVNWFRREQTLSQVGDDPNAWFDKQLDERLKDQKYAGTLMEKIRGGIAPAGAQQQNGGGSVVQIPPSLNTMAASSPTLPNGGDMSDASLWHHAFRAR